MIETRSSRRIAWPTKQRGHTRSLLIEKREKTLDRSHLKRLVIFGRTVDECGSAMNLGDDLLDPVLNAISAERLITSFWIQPDGQR